MTEDQKKTAAALAQAGVTALASVVPGAALAIPFTPAAVRAIIEGYDAIMAARPGDVTEAEWRQRLLDRALNETFDEGRNRARAEAEAADLPLGAPSH
jgi:hypothetical protein